MRLIDADKLMIDMMDRGVDHIQTDDLMELNQIIDEQPTVEQQKWIPCSEKLPEEDGLYLVTDVSKYFGAYSPYVLKREKASLLNCVKWGTIVAWMPLPEPYKEGEDESTSV